MNLTRVRGPASKLIIWHPPLLELLAVLINNEPVAVFHHTHKSATTILVMRLGLANPWEPSPYALLASAQI